MFKKLFFYTLILASTQAFSATNTWFTGTVKSVYPLASGDFIIIFNEDSAECTNAGKSFNVTVGQNAITSEASSHMLSVAMTAGVANKQLMVSFDKDSESCFVNRMKVMF